MELITAKTGSSSQFFLYLEVIDRMNVFRNTSLSPVYSASVPETEPVRSQKPELKE